MFPDKTESEMMSQKQFVAKDSAAQLRRQLNSMSAIQAPKKSVVLSFLKILPFLNRFIAVAESVGYVFNGLVALEGHLTNAVKVAGRVFNVIRLIGLGRSFFETPYIYVRDWQKNPITLSRNARFLYATVILGLTITAIAFPLYALVIGLVMALFGLGLSVITMARLICKRDEIQDRLKNLENNIKIKKESTNRLIDELARLERAGKDSENAEQLRNQIGANLNELQMLYNQQEHCKQKLERLGLSATLDKSMGIILACMGLTGAVASFVAPPVGLIILTITASVGLVYLVGRLTYPIFKYLAEKVPRVFAHEAEQPEIELQELTNSRAFSNKNQNESQCDKHTLKPDFKRPEEVRVERVDQGYSFPSWALDRVTKREKHENNKEDRSLSMS